MAITSAEELAQQALSHNLLNERQLQEVWASLGGRSVSLEEFRQTLLRRDLLTYYHIEHLIQGDRTSFHYGDNKVLYLVGTGTFARVYRGVNSTNNQTVAVKVLRKRFSDVREEVQRFLREGEMGKDLRHPNIVPIFEVASKNGAHYIVIEFVEGQNLHEFMRVRKTFDPVEATTLILDVANGLDYAFRKGITHRDLKMSNVLVSSRGQARLVDFGLASLDKHVSDEVLIKNPNPRAIDYAGLERATGVRRDDPRSDIFFAGCMYYHMLSGTAPLSETRDRSQRLNRSRFQEIVPISQTAPNIPIPVAAVVNKALHFNPDSRYQTPGELAFGLREVLSGMNAGTNPLSVAGGQAGTLAAAEGEGVGQDGEPRTVMIVDSHPKMQDLLRERLKQKGYRVLVMGDPQRAMARFAEHSDAADAVVFCTGQLDRAALDAFNQFGSAPRTQQIPSILLLDERHEDWRPQAMIAGHRRVLSMPIKLRQLSETLIRILDVAAHAK